MEVTLIDYYTPVPTLGRRRIIRAALLREKTTAWDIAAALSTTAGPVSIVLNGKVLGLDNVKSVTIADGDLIEVLPVAQEPISGAIISYFALEGVAAALVTIAVNLAVTYAINALMNTSQGGNVAERKRVKEGESYGLTGGGNQQRPLAPMPLILGTTRVFPDLNSQPVPDYIEDARATIPGLSATPNYEYIPITPFVLTLFNPWQDFPPTLLAPWTVMGGAYGAGLLNDHRSEISQPAFPIPGQFYYYADNVPRTYLNNLGVSVTMPHTFVMRVRVPNNPDDAFTAANGVAVEVIRYEDAFIFDPTPANPYPWAAYTAGMTLPVITGYDVLIPNVVQRLTQVFNFGFGVLTFAEDHLGTTPLADYEQFDLRTSVNVPNASPLIGWTRAPRMFAGLSLPFPENCENVDGGKLEQNASVPDSGWIQRRSTRRLANYIEFDLNGRIGEQTGGGPVDLNVDFEFQYRAVGAAVWLGVPGIGTYRATNGQQFTLYKRTLGFAIAAGFYEVRVRKVTADPTVSGQVVDMHLERVKFFQEDSLITYTAQNRRGLEIVASSQLNGALDRYSVLVAAHTWRYANGVAFDGTNPGGSANWSFGPTRNPADWILYLAAGGYYNTVNPLGWNLGENAANGDLIFGLGWPWARIDISRFVQFREFCRLQNLEFSEVVDKASSVFEVMDDIARVGRGSISYANGKLTVVWTDAAEPITSVFGMGNIVAGSFSVSYRSEQTYDQVKLSYKNRDKFYSIDYAVADVPGVTAPTRYGTVASWGVDRPTQAQREANLEVARQLYFDATFTWEASTYGSRIWRRDVALLAHDLTSWVYSGRVYAFTVLGNVPKTIQLDRVISAGAAVAPYYIYLLLPNGAQRSVEVAPPVGETDTLVVLAGLFGNDMPNTADSDTGTFNADSPTFEHTVYAHDYTYLAGPTATPGRKVRIIDVEPQSNGNVKLTAVPETADFYAQEFALTAPPATPPAGTLVARAAGVTFERRADGVWLTWALENATTADVALSVNGGPAGPLTATSTVAGITLKLPGSFAVGTLLTATVTPLVGALGVAAVPDSTTYRLE